MQRSHPETDPAGASQPLTPEQIGALFVAARAGDEAAQRRAFDATFPRLHAMLRRQLNCSESTAEDLAQEALIRAMNPRVPAANLEIAPFGWLMKVARRLRDPRGRPMLPLRDDDARAPDVHAPDQPEARAFFFLAFQQALEKLSAEEREAVGLLARRVPGGQLKKRTGREIAQLMGKGESSVAKYLHSARGKIVKHFRVYHPGLYEEHGVYFRKFFEAQND